MLNPEILIESLDHEARGVGHADGKVVFVDGALPGERVRYSSYRKKQSYEQAQMVELLAPSAQRVVPLCPHFGVCGGCSMQHLDARAQVAVKQRVLEDNLWHIGRLRPEVMFRAIHGPSWGYRFRARLSVRNVPKKGGVLVGFHERKRSYIADMQSCAVLPPHVSALLMPLRALIEGLSIKERAPQIELAVGEDATVLVLRNLEPLTADDEALLRAFADRHGVHFWLQPKGPDSALPLHLPPDSLSGSADSELNYVLPEFGVRMPFKPTDFTQVNHHINRVLVRRALRLLDAQPHERIADLFCGLGNFTLPIATRAAEVLGVEGSETLVQRARDNAQANGLASKARFLAANLFEATLAQVREWGRFDKVLIDPPREGAIALAKAFSALAAVQGSGEAPARIVYVSCNPSTLARDAAVLVHEGGYVLRGAGVVNMFPQTSHVESIALFERANPGGVNHAEPMKKPA